MNINLKIGGMSCKHCVASVKSALEAVDGVTSADVNLENGSASVVCDDCVAGDTLVSAVDDIGFDAELV